MEAPERIEPKVLGEYLEVLSKAVFQTGISWDVVNKKWPGIREAMHGFDAMAIASLSEADVEQLASDPRVIRNRRKLAGIVENARTMLEIDSAPGGFAAYLRSHDDFGALIRDLTKRFKFLGPTGAYYFLYVVGEDVPSHEDFMAANQRRR